jgi:hypothetical protein
MIYCDPAIIGGIAYQDAARIPLRISVDIETLEINMKITTGQPGHIGAAIRGADYLRLDTSTQIDRVSWIIGPFPSYHESGYCYEEPVFHGGIPSLNILYKICPEI